MNNLKTARRSRMGEALLRMLMTICELGSAWKDPELIPVAEIIEEWRSQSTRGRYESRMWSPEMLQAFGRGDSNMDGGASSGGGGSSGAGGSADGGGPEEGDVDNLEAGGIFSYLGRDAANQQQPNHRRMSSTPPPAEDIFDVD